jgi:hypothetical protein
VSIKPSITYQYMKERLHNAIPLIHEPFACKMKINDEACVLARNETVKVNALYHKMR